MTDIESLLREATDLPPSTPVEAVRGAVRRSRRRRRALAAVAAVAAVAVALPFVVGRSSSDTLVPAAAPESCPSQFSLPTEGPVDRLLPADVAEVRVCVYEPADVTGYSAADLAGGSLRESRPVDLSSAASSALLTEPQAPANLPRPACLATRQVRVLLIGIEPDGRRTPAALTNPCSTYFTNGSFETEDADPAASLLDIDPLDLLSPERPPDPAASKLVRVTGVVLGPGSDGATASGDVVFSTAPTSGPGVASTLQAGRFYAYLAAGDYDVTVSAPGLRCKGLRDLALTGTQQTVRVDCVKQ